VTRSNARREQASRLRDDFFRQPASADQLAGMNRAEYTGKYRHRPDALAHGESAQAGLQLMNRAAARFRQVRQNSVFHSRVHDVFRSWVHDA
jgi:hypothetical protein